MKQPQLTELIELLLRRRGKIMKQPQLTELIELLLREKKSFQGEQVFRDEPILRPANQLKNYTPPIYKQLRELSSKYGSSRNRLFYEQAKLMADFKDDCPLMGEFICYFPTYQAMNLPQLRGYFTWRSQYKEGTTGVSSLSYLYVYLYELLMGIGYETASEGLTLLKNIYEKESDSFASLKLHLKQWIKDFAIYHALPMEQVEEYVDRETDEAIETLTQWQSIEDDTLFPAMEQLSSYRISNSKLYKSYPAEAKTAVCNAFRLQSEYYDKHRKSPYLRRLFGGWWKSPYTMFASAVFYEPKRHKDCVYVLSPLESYRCSQGNWMLERDYVAPQRSKELGELIKLVDCRLRPKFKLPPIQPPKKLTKTLSSLVDKATENIDRKPEKPVFQPVEVHIDISKLGSIRQSAELTKEKLMTKEEADFSEEQANTLQDEPCKNGLLNQVEVGFLQCLLNGQNAFLYAKAHRQTVDMLTDSVNEKLYEQFSDTVIYTDGENVELIEDYIEELKESIML